MDMIPDFVQNVRKQSFRFIKVVLPHVQLGKVDR
jgi:hypothetical protein